MSEEFLQPLSLDAPPSGGKSADKKHPHQFWWLVLAVVLVLFGLRWFSSRNPQITVAVPTPTPAPLPTATPDPSLRLAAEAALEKVVALTGPLRAAEPERWAEDAWQQVEEKMSTADQFFADADYGQAGAAYEALLPELESLHQQLPLLPVKLMPLAVKAYATGEKEEAVALLQIVLSLDPTHAEAAALLPRAEHADRSFALLNKAKDFAQAENWDAAAVELNRLEQLDAAFPGFAELDQEVTTNLSEKLFRKWISQAVLALEDGDLTSAQALAEKAQNFRPENAEVQGLRKQIAERILQNRVLEWKDQAEKFAAEENWSAAHRSWLEMKALDPEAPWIEEGLQHSLKWKLLEEKINKGLADPGAAQTASWLKEMQDRSDWPDGLAAQAASLEEKHLLAVTPVTVTLKSDFETGVEIAKVGRWKPFRSKEIQLKPGKYVAKGIRLGYRDVRIPFEVKSGAKGLVVEVICVEGI